MTLAYKLFGSGLNTLTVASMGDVATGLTATGTTQAGALEVTSAKNAFTTVAALSRGERFEGLSPVGRTDKRLGSERGNAPADQNGVRVLLPFNDIVDRST